MIRGELFSQDMVKAFLENRKFRTSRPIKCKYDNTHIKWFTNKYGTRLVEMQNDVEGETFGKNSDGSTWHHLLACRELKPKHSAGDVIYARETFYQYGEWYDTVKHFKTGEYISTHVFIPKDGHPIYFEDTIPSDVEVKHGHKSGLGYYKRPSLFMPREIARIFLKVTDVKVQRLNDVSEQDAVEDGFTSTIQGNAFITEVLIPLQSLHQFWNQQYGEYQPWMWVYCLQSITKEEALKEIEK